MGLGQIEHVDIIANTGAVRCGVVGAEDVHRFTLAEGDLEHVGDEVGFDHVVLTEFFRGPGGIEVAQGDIFEPVAFVIPAEDLFKKQLRFAVGINGILRQGLVNRHTLGDAEGGAGGGENEFLHAVLHRDIEEIDAVGHVVAEILGGILHGLTDEGVGGEMHDGIGFHLAHGVAEDGAIKEVALEKFGAGINRLTVAFAEIIENRDLVTFVEKLFNADAADVAGSAGHENRFHGNHQITGMAVTIKSAITRRQTGRSRSAGTPHRRP